MSDETPALPSPRDEVSPLSLDELFALDPLEMTDEQIMQMVQAYRQDRHNWVRVEEQKKLTGKKPKAEKAPATPAAPMSEAEVQDLLGKLVV